MFLEGLSLGLEGDEHVPQVLQLHDDGGRP